MECRCKQHPSQCRESLQSQALQVNASNSVLRCYLGMVWVLSDWNRYGLVLFGWKNMLVGEEDEAFCVKNCDKSVIGQGQQGCKTQLNVDFPDMSMKHKGQCC